MTNAMLALLAALTIAPVVFEAQAQSPFEPPPMEQPPLDLQGAAGTSVAPAPTGAGGSGGAGAAAGSVGAGAAGTSAGGGREPILRS